MLDDPVILLIGAPAMIGAVLFIALYIVLGMDDAKREREVRLHWWAVGYKEGKECITGRKLNLTGDTMNKEYMKGFNEGLEERKRSALDKVATW